MKFLRVSTLLLVKTFCFEPLYFLGSSSSLPTINNLDIRDELRAPESPLSENTNKVVESLMVEEPNDQAGSSGSYHKNLSNYISCIKLVRSNLTIRF